MNPLRETPASGGRDAAHRERSGVATAANRSARARPSSGKSVHALRRHVDRRGPPRREMRERGVTRTCSLREIGPVARGRVRHAHRAGGARAGEPSVRRCRRAKRGPASSPDRRKRRGTQAEPEPCGTSSWPSCGKEFTHILVRPRDADDRDDHPALSADAVRVHRPDGDRTCPRWWSIKTSRPTAASSWTSSARRAHLQHQAGHDESRSTPAARLAAGQARGSGS